MLLSKNKNLLTVLAVIYLLLQQLVFAQKKPDNDIQIYESIENNKLRQIKIQSPQNNVVDNPTNTHFEEVPQSVYYVMPASDEDNKEVNTNKKETTIESSYYNGSNYDDLDSITPVKTQQESQTIPTYNSLNPANENAAIDDLSAPITLEDINMGLSSNPKRVDLATSIQLALNNNLDIKISNARRLQGKWQYAQAFSSLLPNINLSYSQSRYQGTILVGGIFPVTVLRTSIVPSLQADVEAFKGFQNLFNNLSAHHQYNASKKELESTIEDKTYEVTEAYYNLLRDKSKVLIAQKTVEDAKEELKLNNDRYYAGTGTKFDVLQSQSLVSESEQKLIQGQNALKLSMVIFSNLLGEDLFAEVLPIENDIAVKTILDAEITLDDMVDIALLSRPEVERDRELIKSLIMQKRASYSTYLPQATVTGGLDGSGSRLNNVSRSQYISLNLKWLGLSNLGTLGVFKTKEIGAKVNEAKLNLENTLRTIQKDVISSYYSRESAKKLIDSARAEVVSTQEGLRLAEIRLKAGVGTNSDYVSAQVAFTDAKVNWVNAVIDYNLAEVKLLKDMGIINLERLTKGVNKSEISSIYNRK